MYAKHVRRVFVVTLLHIRVLCVSMVFRVFWLVLLCVCLVCLCPLMYEVEATCLSPDMYEHLSIFEDFDRDK